MITTHTFDYHISPAYFPGYKVTKPFYATVRATHNDLTDQVNVTSVMFTPQTLKVISGMSALMDEITDACVILVNPETEEELVGEDTERWDNYKRANSY